MSEYPISEEVLTAEKIRRRIENQKEWLLQSDPFCFQEQKHTIEGTSERIYWHYGYRSALVDVIERIAGLEAENASLRSQLRLMQEPVSDEEWLGLCSGDHVQFTDMQRSDLDSWIAARTQKAGA